MDICQPHYRCFAPTRRPAQVVIESSLSSRAAEALATLLPILGCGEEAAGLAFEHLAVGQNTEDSCALRRIAGEEWVHDGLIHSLAAGLPPAPELPALRSAMRRFHLDLGRGALTVRLARIAALDSAVCLILSRLVRPGAPLSRDAATSAILRRIASDEARHVRVTRQLAMAREEQRRLLQVAMPVRERLAALLEFTGEAFDTLAFDPRWLRNDVARLPVGLFR